MPLVGAACECDWEGGAGEDPRLVNVHCQVISPRRLWTGWTALSRVYAAKKEAMLGTQRRKKVGSSEDVQFLCHLQKDNVRTNSATTFSAGLPIQHDLAHVRKTW